MAEDRFIEITNREIWQKLLDIEKNLTTVSTDYRLQATLSVDLQKRVRSLELRFYGILAGLIGAIGTFVALLSKGGS